jgi:peroxiredoxin
MKLFALTLALAALLPFASAHATEAAATPVAEVGKQAPDFTGTDTKGKTHKLSDFKGKTVVLEWTNPGCPFVMKHYDSNNMQTLQKNAVADGVIWLSVASSAADKEGYLNGADSDKYMTEKGSAPTARLLDPEGTIGHLYGAKTTPHMFVINADGIVVYAGAIDSNDNFKPETIKGATNYVVEALKALKEGKPVEVASTKPYGCGVKYAN